VPLVLGGIVPESDFKPLQDLGVSAVFSPGSSINSIVTRLRELSQARPEESAESLIEAYSSGQMRALARLITRLQRGQIPADFTPPEGTATVVGITGAPGVGKSSFISRLATPCVSAASGLPSWQSIQPVRSRAARYLAIGCG
jgi:ABC-type transport system involved in cytochrome bd biosynthesis fused ATPase/permease subunit